ncbi:uncharacterized protein G2W53_010038 [Senna tora]|uniref:Uncharacterized protein n=1 Tax=Senna tora TaxID=362788 RepID=A0A834WZ76_9FABA|nr:uncharacterized protein G2W53_010038 [Senna tora]
MRLRCIANPSGSNARMGLVIAWELCQLMSKNILIGKQRLNLKRIQEAQVQTCCRTIESQKNPGSTSSNVLSHKGVKRMRSRCIGNQMALMLEWDLRSHGRFKRMRSRCIGNPSGSKARMGLVIAWDLYQVMSKHILKGKRRLNLKRLHEAQVRTCCRTSESNGFVRVVLGIRVGLMLEWDS